MNKTFEITESPGPHDVAVLSLRGELDVAGCDEAARAIGSAEERRPARIVLDLRELQFIDSSGLRVFAQAQRHADEGGWRLGIVPGPAPVQRVLELSGLSKLFEVVSPRDVDL